MRLQLIRTLIRRGFIECAYCGNIYRKKNSLKTTCEYCSNNKS